MNVHVIYSSENSRAALFVMGGSVRLKFSSLAGLFCKAENWASGRAGLFMKLIFSLRAGPGRAFCEAEYWALSLAGLFCGAENLGQVCQNFFRTCGRIFSQFCLLFFQGVLFRNIKVGPRAGFFKS